MEIYCNDYTFTSVTGSPTIEYGQSTDCNGESFRNPCPRFSEAVINSMGTGLIVDPTIKWGKISGWWAEVKNLDRSTDGSQISFVCTGWCGECGPTSGPITLQPSKEFISATEAKAFVCNFSL
ncbi:A disintegrin and metalloproteinase with thrombospondin motifs 9-like [Saccostrea cucullata]|uniref:A disintegrin and metalloproteinase with thrombospondin motifs 9-like n=1 Tax=Saccostrea cuccullata TaxID=36930 RepID=UPI002ED27785